jgi:predicted RNase H-like HicB family nuclease
VKAKHFTVIIEPDAPRGFHAWVPDLPGCHSDGRTAALAKRRIREAIDLYLETLESRGLPLPIPRTQVTEVLVEVA